MGRESEDPPQETIGPYRIGRRLGSGGMGEVYRGFDERLDRPVALKRIKPEGKADAKTRERFRREAKAVARLSHSAIVQVHDWIETDNGDWFVMEMVEGRSLRNLMNEGRPEPDRVVRIGREIAAGLVVAHAAGLVHRDLKAENVMVTEGGRCKILDFGLAKRLTRQESPPLETVSVEGQLLGTVSAMSPEQATDSPLDHRSDLFSLGTLLYELATGVSPFEEGNQVKTLIGICTVQQTPAHELDTAVPVSLSQLIDQLLRKEPAQRPQSAEEVVQALDRIASGLPAATTASDSARFAPPRPEAAETTAPRRARRGAVIKTLLMSDLVDSTKLMEQLGDTKAARLFEHHDRLARDLLVSHGGQEIDKSDGFLMLFERPIQAVAYAQAFHRALRQLSREEEEGVELRSRVGIHVGEVVLRENPHEDVARGAKPVEVEGLTKAVTARLMSLAAGGQTLLSRSVFEMGRRAAVGAQSIPAGLRWMEHGSYRVKGVEEPLEVFEVGVEGESPLARPAGSAKVRPLDDASQAQKIGARPRWPRHRIAAVALLAVLAAGVIWSALEFRQPDQSRANASVETAASTPIVARIRPSVAVLGFKNLSEDQDASAWLSVALSEMFSTHLAAGRELRLIPGESIARMKLELALADSDTFTADTLRRIRKNLHVDYVAVGSYLMQEHAAGKDLQILVRLQDTENGELVAAVPQTGAASRLFELVSQSGTTLLESLGIGDVSAAEAIAASAALSSNLDATRLYSEGLSKLRSYDALAARQLLEQAVAADPGYALAYAALSQAWSTLGYDKEAEASAKQALDRAQDQQLPREEVLTIEGRYYEVSSQRQNAIRTYQALWGFYPDNLEYGLHLALAQKDAGQLQEALATVASLRALPDQIGDDPRIDLTESRVANYQADHQRMLAAADRAVRKSQEHEAKFITAEARYNHGIALRRLGRFAEAARELEESQRLFDELGDRGAKAQVMNSYGLLRSEQGRIAEAEMIYRQALVVHRQTGNQGWVATILNNLANVIRIRGDLATAKQMLEESLAITRKIDDRNREVWKFLELGLVLLEQSDLDAATRMAQEALTGSEEIGNERVVAKAQHLLGSISLARGETTEALDWHEQALRSSTTMGEKHQSALALRSLGETLLAKGDLQGGMRRLEEAEAIQLELGETGTLATTRLSQAALLLELGKHAEAETLAAGAAEEFANQERPDDELLANAVLTRAFLAQEKLAEARALIEVAAKRAKSSQRPSVRFDVALAAARADAANGDSEAALASLSKVRAEAEQLGRFATELEVRLALGEIGLAKDGPARVRADLQALATEARAAGFVRIAEKAEALGAAMAP